MEDGPPWANPKQLSSVHVFYEKIWNMVKLPLDANKTNHELVDSSVVSTLLVTSGLTTGMLGYIWSLANNTVPGALTQHELYCVLGLVALAQRGRDFKSVAELKEIPVPPIPKLDLSIIEQMKTLSVAAVDSKPEEMAQPSKMEKEEPKSLFKASFSEWRDPTIATTNGGMTEKQGMTSSSLSGFGVQSGSVRKKKKRKKKCISLL